jgi:mitogen-activated protein kinase kinase kinase
MGNSVCSKKPDRSERRSLSPREVPSIDDSLAFPIRPTGIPTYLPGGRNVVYRRFNEADGRPLVVKELKLTKMNERQRKTLENEVTIFKSLKHPNIVRFYDCEIKKDTLFIYMEYMDGGSLADQIKQGIGGRVIENLASNFLFQILTGLKYLHEKCILHRDLKCANVLYSSTEGICKLSDFGSAVHVNDLSYSNKGTPGFTAPEVWSLGSAT